MSEYPDCERCQQLAALHEAAEERVQDLEAQIFDAETEANDLAHALSFHQEEAHGTVNDLEQFRLAEKAGQVRMGGIPRA